MRRALILLLAVGCGGKLFGDNPGGSTDASAQPDTNDPLGGGGHLLSGKCHFTSSFRPNGGMWIFQTDTDGVSTATRNGKNFTLLCTGKGNESFYYELKTNEVATAIGTFMTTGQLVQVSNGREAEVTDFGPCTVVVTALGKQDIYDTVTGTFDCPSLKTLTGEFSHKGTFTVPLP